MKYCNSCVYCNKDNETCLVHKIHININKDFCSKHATQFTFCECCNQPIISDASRFVQDNNNEWHYYCSRCAELLKTCQTCSNSCEFETNPDPMPKIVTKIIRQNNMQMQIQVKNPDRIQKFCTSCNCYNEECGCKREFNMGCDKKN